MTSKTLWSEGQARIDSRKIPLLEKGPGQIHYQDATGKYIYDVAKGEFQGLSATQNRKLLDSPEVKDAIQKGLLMTSDPRSNEQISSRSSTLKEVAKQVREVRKRQKEEEKRKKKEEQAK